jgi:two-component system, OmpR family, alkaline phosphatase synthesis response regulator PhoP
LSCPYVDEARGAWEGKVGKLYRVVVADDEPHIRHVLEVKLAKAGLNVVMAADGEEALELCRAQTPDLVISDYQMPAMSGLDLCKELFRQPATAKVPVIMLTARGFDLTEADKTKTNIVLVMSKPFSPAEVLAKAMGLLGDVQTIVKGR